jgi:hypothetical protein
LLVDMRDLPHPFWAACGETTKILTAVVQRSLPKVSVHTATRGPNQTRGFAILPSLNLRT